MKKGIIISVIVLIIAIVGINIFIPNQLKVSNVAFVHVRESSALRYLSNKYQWAKWWTVDNPNTSKASWDSNNIFNYNQDIYEVTEHKLTGADIIIYHQQKAIKSTINIFLINSDSIALQWTFNIRTGFNPIKKLIAYNDALAIKKNMDNVLSELNIFLENNKNIYGLDIKKQIVADTFFIAQKAAFKSYPSTKEVYGLMHNIQEYVTAQHAKVNGFPMLHVTKTDSSNYEVMVALPIDKMLTGNTIFSFKRMVRGLILSSEINGGNYTANQAFQTMQNYIHDYGLTEIALPFQSLITNRENQLDTSKWVTKLYYPVF